MLQAVLMTGYIQDLYNTQREIIFQTWTFSKKDTFGTGTPAYIYVHLRDQRCLSYRESSELHKVTVRKAWVNSRCLIHRGVY